MFNFKSKQMLAKDIGIDLGTATVLVYVEGKGIVLNEPSVVAVNKDTDTIAKIGKDAQIMLGRNPENIEVVRPLRDGVINRYDVTGKYDISAKSTYLCSNGYLGGGGACCS